ncbi:Maf family protein [Sediminibacillus massiliensis]|uniref:Maf family protein n=1 Tax=Sediminibacillus massiliensis TaxID=1926277 RepID=UPI0009883B6E|nr:Maf family protein [Sediminibacillus massiliensis]
MKRLILASGSPRRRELLQQAGIPFSIRKQEIDEEAVRADSPRQLVEKLARYKGEAIQIGDEEVVISADTVVSYKDKILTKPHSKEEAMEMLSLLNGKQHEVQTGVMIRTTQIEEVFSVETKVLFWEHRQEDLAAYVETGDPFDKAGGYGIQTRGAFLVKEIAGDYYNVVGLPVSLVIRKLKEFGIFPV